MIEESINRSKGKNFQIAPSSVDENSMFQDEENPTVPYVNKVISIEFLESTNLVEDHDSGPFFRIIFPLVMLISDLQAATSKLREVIGVLKSPKFEDFVVYLKLAEVYGTGYLDDVDF